MVDCETCPSIFSRKECLHSKCHSHQAELAAFQREIDDHIHAMVVQAWHPRTKSIVAPNGAGTNDRTHPQSLSQSVCGESPQGAYDHHYSGKAPEVQTSETENINVVSRKSMKSHNPHNAQTSRTHHPPGKNEAAGDILPPRNHDVFLALAAYPLGQGGFKTFRDHSKTTAILTYTDEQKRIASDLLPVRPPIFSESSWDAPDPSISPPKRLRTEGRWNFCMRCRGNPASSPHKWMNK